MKPAAQTQAPLFELLPWDTEFFGRRIGRINAKQLSPEEMTTISEWARREKIECLYLWLDPQAVASVRLAEQTGFCLTDVRLTFALSLPSERREVSVEAKETVTLRPSTAFDIAALEKMTDGLFTKARFYSDDHFLPPRRTVFIGAGFARAAKVRPIGCGSPSTTKRRRAISLATSTSKRG